MTEVAFTQGNASAIGAGLGLIFGVGLVLVILWNPWTRPRSVEARISPFVRRGEFSHPFSSKEFAWIRHPFIQRTIAPTIEHWRRYISRAAGSVEDIQLKLRHAGLDTTVSAYRLEQAMWGLASFLGSAAIAVTVAATKDVSVIALLIAVLIASAVGFLSRDYYLTHQVGKRSALMAREFPTVADLLALAVAAGESPLAAMERVARTSTGALSSELGVVIADIHAGQTIDQALVSLGKRTPLPALTRFSEAVAVAIERGTPLADVLRAQAQDARDESKRQLMETAGKREVAMLMPVVFFLMPLVIVFAIFPGLSVLKIGI